MKKILAIVALIPATLWAKASVVFTAPPQAQTVCVGSPATFTAGATGAGPLTYQWQVSINGGASWTNITDGATYTGTTTMTLRVTSANATFNNNQYRCNVSDGTPGTSTAAILHVNTGTGPVPPLSGNSAQTQCANTTGSSPVNTLSSFSYQWQLSTDGITWNNLDPADPAYFNDVTDPVLQWDGSLPPNTAYLYRYTMTNTTSGCTAISAIDTVRIAPAPTTLQPTPASASICSGGDTTFTFVSPPSGYAFNWQVSSDNGVNYTDLSNNATYSGVSSASLTVTGITTALRYRARTSLTTFNLTCGTFSNPSTLTMKTLPAITGQPADLFVCAGTSPRISVTATGSNLTFQWQTDNGTNGTAWSNASGTGTTATTTRITLNPVTVPMDGFKYQVIVGGPCGSPKTSNAVTLRIGSSGTWLGAQDTAWEHVGNWCSIVPVQTTDVLVPSWAPRMPLISAGTGTAFSQSLTIQSGASLTISGGATSMTGPFSIPGTVLYTGTMDQNVLPADHGSLYISGSGNKIMQSDVAITNTLGLGGAAKLVTGTHILTMNTGSNPISGAAFGVGATSWIVTGNGGTGAANTGLGGLRMLQVPATASNLLFPLGPTPATYNPLLLTNGGAANDFTIAVNDQNIPGGPVGSVIDRTWQVTAANAGSHISLNLQWVQPDEPVTFDRTNAAVIRSNGLAIVEKSGAGAAAGPNPYSMNGGSFSNITQFSVGNNTTIVLSLQLLNFSAQWLDDATAGLTWAVGSQEEASYYTIQRSTDGIRFTDIGTVRTIRGTTSYKYVDQQPSTNNSYRLAMATPGGNIQYSRIVQLFGSSIADQAVLAPSVTSGSTTTLQLTLQQAGDIIYKMTDLSGHTLTQKATRLGTGQQRISLDLSQLPAGLYYVQVTDSGGNNRILTLVKK